MKTYHLYKTCPKVCYDFSGGDALVKLNGMTVTVENIHGSAELRYRMAGEAISHQQGWQGLLPSRQTYQMRWGNNLLNNVSYSGDVADLNKVLNLLKCNCYMPPSYHELFEASAAVDQKPNFISAIISRLYDFDKSWHSHTTWH